MTDTKISVAGYTVNTIPIETKNFFVNLGIKEEDILDFVADHIFNGDLKKCKEYGMSPYAFREWYNLFGFYFDKAYACYKAGLNPHKVKSKITAECSRIQIFGFMACNNCPKAETEECEGINILETGLNLFGNEVPVVLS